MDHGSATPNAATLDAVLTRLDAMSRDVTYLAERQRKQQELLSELTPILKEVLATATSKLDEVEKKGYFAFARELSRVGQQIVEGYTAEDVRALGDAVVGILDTARALTQPKVLDVMTDASRVIAGSEDLEPLGIVGMVRATRHEDVQRGMAVMMELLRHVGRAADAVAERRADSPLQRKRERLAEITAGRRKKGVLGTERTPPARVAHRTIAKPAQGTSPDSAPMPQTTRIDGVSFTPDGHLADPSAWTRALAETLAAAHGLPLTAAHWQVVEFARKDFEERGASPNIRRITQSVGIATKDLYTLFPRAPARTVAKIAGIPKPAGCL